MKLYVRGYPILGTSLVGIFILFSAHVAQAQCGEQQTMMQLNRDAMQAYGNMNFNPALQMLQQASRVSAPCVPRAVVARTYINLGVVHLGGFMNNAEGIDAFRRAICFDPMVLLDPLTSTPDIQTAFRLAQSQNQQQGCPSGTGQQQQNGGQQQQTIVPPTMQEGFELYRHNPVKQQLRRHPVPLYIEVNPAVQCNKIMMYYRVAGEVQYTSLEMDSIGSNTFSVQIPCDTINLFDPTYIDYYFEIYRPDGGIIGIAPDNGADQPHRIEMVETLQFEPPTIPGEAPLEICVNCDDIAPGMPRPPECQRTCESGRTCDVDDDCLGKNFCEQGCCVSERTNGSETGFRPRGYVQVGAGWGGGYVKATGDEIIKNTIDTPVAALYRNVDDPAECTPPAGNNSSGEARELRVSEGGACWHRTSGAGFGYGAGHVRIYAGGYILPFLSVGAYFRYQFSGFEAEGYYNWAVGLRLRYHPIQTEKMELSVGLTVQIWGMEQVYLNLKGQESENIDKAYRIGGYQAVGLMLGYAYYFIRYVGLFVEIVSDFTMGEFLWNLDLTAGPTFRF